MKKLLQKSGSLILALLVLFSTVSFTVDKHFCGKMLVDLAVFSEVETCGMDMHNTAGDMAEDSCCKEEKVFVEGQDELKITFENLDLEQQLFVTSFTYSYLELFKELPEQEDPFKEYIPPLLVADIQLLDQVFLI